MMLLRTTVLVIALSCVCNAAESRSTARQKLLEYLDEPAERGSVFSQAALDHVDYRNILRGAITQNEASISCLFRYTASGRLMGEGADTNCDIIRQILILLGDKSFAKALKRETAKTQKSVISELKWTWAYPGLQASNYPLTFKLASHENK